MGVCVPGVFTYVLAVGVCMCTCCVYICTCSMTPVVHCGQGPAGASRRKEQEGQYCTTALLLLPSSSPPPSPHSVGQQCGCTERGWAGIDAQTTLHYTRHTALCCTAPLCSLYSALHYASRTTAALLCTRFAALEQYSYSEPWVGTEPKRAKIDCVFFSLKWILRVKIYVALNVRNTHWSPIDML